MPLTIKSTGEISSSLFTVDSDGDVINAGELQPTTALSATYLNVGQIGGRRNLIINGSQIVDQRNATVTAAGTFVTDRFKHENNSSSDASVQQVSEAPDTFKNSLKLTTTATKTPSGSTYAGLTTRIEGQDTVSIGLGTTSCKQFTVSFWVRSTKIGTYSISFKNSGANRVYLAEYTISAANTWEYKTLTIPAITTGTWNTDNSTGMIITWWLAGTASEGTAGSWLTSNANMSTNQVNLFDATSATWQITGIQLEVGSIATPFEHRSYGEELALCQRYFYAHQARSNYIMTAAATGEAIISIFFPCRMRTNPSMTHNISGYNDGTAYQHNVYKGGVISPKGSGTLYNWGSSVDGVAFASTMASTTAGDAGNINFGSAVVISFNAEL